MRTYKHYIGIDWAQARMAVARITDGVELPVYEGPTDLKELKLYLKRLKGTKIMAIEESTPSQAIISPRTKVLFSTLDSDYHTLFPKF